MGLEAIWQRFAIAIYHIWIWLRYEFSLHPFLFLGIGIVIVSAWALYKMEVRGK